MKTSNLDVNLLGKEVLLFRNEVFKSASSEVFNVDIHDMTRLESYLARLERDLQHVVAMPKLDLPKWHKQEIEMPEIQTDYQVDNASVEYVLRILDAGYFELVSSQSSSLSNGLEIADAKRVEMLISRLKAWIVALKDTQEVDVPEHANSNGQ